MERAKKPPADPFPKIEMEGDDQPEPLKAGYGTGPDQPPPVKTGYGTDQPPPVKGGSYDAGGK